MKKFNVMMLIVALVIASALLIGCGEDTPDVMTPKPTLEVTEEPTPEPTPTPEVTIVSDINRIERY